MLQNVINNFRLCMNYKKCIIFSLFFEYIKEIVVIYNV